MCKRGERFPGIPGNIWGEERKKNESDWVAKRPAEMVDLWNQILKKDEEGRRTLEKSLFCVCLYLNTNFSPQN